jgi:hypothetical protein
MLSDMFMALDSLRLDAEELVNITHYGR